LVCTAHDRPGTKTEISIVTKSQSCSIIYRHIGRQSSEISQTECKESLAGQPEWRATDLWRATR
jgi:hypothetical protein